ncbi:MAG TPA: TspO/MBR family protein [Xanthobacteraceae bacterium]|nr:TspO/MBR family protein [Xanthobacteraceae bacterium]
MIADRAQRWKPVLVAALAATAVATLGALMTDLGPWYVNLHKPSWQPPGWLFGPAWTLIFGLCALSGYLAWLGAPNRGGRDGVLALFALNGLFNVLWSVLFFWLERPDWALTEALLLWLSILLMILALARYSKIASTLLVPCLAWVSFAIVLNWMVVQLNAPFAGA